MYVTWLSNLPPVCTMWPKQKWTGLCVADAFAAGDKCGIGGVIVFPSGQCSWFSLPMTHSDFQSLQIPVHDNLQKDISSLETLAQIVLVYIAIQFFPVPESPFAFPHCPAILQLKQRPISCFPLPCQLHFSWKNSVS